MVIHSFLTLIFVFPREVENKNTTCFFLIYFPGKVHTPFTQDLVGSPLFYTKIGFFFSVISGVFSQFFYFLEKLICHSYFDLRAVFSVYEKKAFLFMQSIFSKNIYFMNFAGIKIRYLCVSKTILKRVDRKCMKKITLLTKLTLKMLIY